MNIACHRQCGQFHKTVNIETNHLIVILMLSPSMKKNMTNGISKTDLVKIC